jgi:hypothetical protein
MVDKFPLGLLFLKPSNYSHKLKHNFLQANVSQPILGTDFFKHHNAEINFSTGCIIFAPSCSPPLCLTSLPPNLFPSAVNTTSISFLPNRLPEVAQILINQFPSVTSPTVRFVLIFS